MSKSKVDTSLRYLKSHEWARLDGDEVVVGISDHAQQAMGDLVYVEVPRVGDAIKAGDRFGVVESVKAASDVYMAAWRGHGVAAALLAACETLARERGMLYLKLAVVTSNAPASRAYERAGFRGYGVEPCVIKLGDACYDELLMAKHIA